MQPRPSAEPKVWSRTFGSGRVAVICEGSGWWPMDRALDDDVPESEWRAIIETDSANRMPIDFNLAHVSLSSASVLVDTGFGDYDPTDPSRPLVSVKDLHLNARLADVLPTLGVRPADITHVVITHMHGDHILGATRVEAGRRVPMFPNARFYVMEDEWHSAPAWHQVAEPINAQKEALLAADVVDLVVGEREIASGVTFHPAPGESDGHGIVRFALGDSVVYCVGDLFHQPAEVSHPDWIPRFRDRNALISSRREWYPRFADERAWLIPAHHPFPAIGQMERDGQSFQWRAAPDT